MIGSKTKYNFTSLFYKFLYQQVFINLEFLVFLKRSSILSQSYFHYIIILLLIQSITSKYVNLKIASIRALYLIFLTIIIQKVSKIIKKLLKK